MFTQKKLAQIAAYLASRVGRQRLKYMRLMKLMYLADREAMSEFGEPITYDAMYSMDRGMVLSETLNVVREPRKINTEWAAYFSPRTSTSDYYLGVKDFPTRDQLDSLSDADIRVLESTFQKFGHMTEWDLSQYMHDHCAEWEFPNGTRISVDDEKLLRALGLPEEEVVVAAKDVQSERQKNRIFRHR